MPDVSRINGYGIKDEVARDLFYNGNLVNIEMLNQSLSNKITKVEGKGLSSNDFTDEDKEKLKSIPTSNRYTNVLVSVNDFIEDNTFEDYPYKADIVLEGVTTNDYANVVFALSDVQSKNYAPICTTSENIVTIYALERPSSDITISLIEVVKV